ncbi:MAG: InlB B-repeat-containing protein [Sphaerochaetaceae bacterium]|nr:InlB B-repeat-containing protein [Sphaerochaetaceae bacterium]
MKNKISKALLIFLITTLVLSCSQEVTVDSHMYENAEMGTFVVNGQSFATFQDAVDYVNSSKALGDTLDTIYLTKNASGPGAVISSGNFAIDFGGYTFSFTNVTGLYGEDVSNKDFGLTINGGADISLKGLNEVSLFDSTTNLTMVYIEGSDTKLSIDDSPKMVVQDNQYVFWAANGASLTIGSDNDTGTEASITGKIAASGTAENKPTISIKSKSTITGTIEAKASNINLSSGSSIVGTVDASDSSSVSISDTSSVTTVSLTSSDATINTTKNIGTVRAADSSSVNISGSGAITNAAEATMSSTINIGGTTSVSGSVSAINSSTVNFAGSSAITGTVSVDNSILTVSDNSKFTVDTISATNSSEIEFGTSEPVVITSAVKDSESKMTATSGRVTATSIQTESEEDVGIISVRDAEVTVNDEPVDTSYDQFDISITFNANGGTGTMDVQKLPGTGGILSTNSFTREGYIFSGWNTAADGSGTSYSDEALIVNQRTDVTLYAKWTGITYTVVFNANGGTGTMANQSFTYDTAQNLTANSYSRTGYKFAGWSTTVNGAVNYADETSVSNLTSTADGSITLFACWAPSNSTKYIVKHYTENLTDSSYTLNSSLEKYGETASTLTLDNLKETITGFTYSAGFAGTATNGTTIPSSESVTSTTILADGTRVIDLYYTRDTHTVSLTSGTGISSVTGSGTYKYGATVTLGATPSTGYTWSRWTQTSGNADVSSTNNYSFTMGTSDLTYTANTTINNYTISVADNITGGSATVSQSSYNVSNSAQTVTLTATAGTGYTFGSWGISDNSSASISENTLTIPEGTVGDITVTPSFTANTYTVVFNANGGTGTMADQSFTYDTAQNLTANSFSKTGYNFAGWSTSSGGSVIYADGTSVSNLTSTAGGSVTLYASWITITPEYTNQDNWTSEGLSLPTVTYIGRGSTIYSESSEAPTNTGDYTAVFTIGSEKVNVDFTI